MLRVSVLLAVSLADLTAPEGAVAAPASASATPTITPTPPAPPTQGQIQSTLPLNTPQPLFSNFAPLTSAAPPSATEVPAGGPTVTVTVFDFMGNTIYDTPTLRALVASYVGKDLTLAEIYKAADVITRYYQDHGYGIARATLPQQTLDGGRVVLQVVEGRIGKVSVEGNARTRTSAILGQASAVKSGDIYTDSATDRATLLVNDLPALQGQAVLAPGTDFGTADITYKMTEDALSAGQLSVDDYGRADVGRIRVNGEVNLSSPTGSGDRLTADVTHTENDQLDYGGLSYSLPLGPAGGRLSASYNQSRYHVTGAFTALGLRGTSKNGNLAYQYPVLRSRESSFYWGLGFQHAGGISTSTITTRATDPKTGKGLTDPTTGAKEFKTTTTRLSSTNLNLAQLTAFYMHSYEDGSSYNLSGSLSSNGHHDYGNDPKAELARLEVDGGYQLPIGTSWTFVTKGSSVWSPDPLSDTEKFSLGGPDNIRGYPSADVRGDAGFYGSLELQHSLVPEHPVSLGAFFDFGRVWSRHFDTPFTGTNQLGQKVSGVSTTPPEVHTLESVGTELVYQSSDKRWESRLEWAYAVGYAKPSDGNAGGHIWATFGMNF